MCRQAQAQFDCIVTDPLEAMTRAPGPAPASRIGMGVDAAEPRAPGHPASRLAGGQPPNGRSVRTRPQACTTPARTNGRRVIAGPPARTIALATAGPSGGTPGSPTPVGAAVLGTMNTSTTGIS